MTINDIKQNSYSVLWGMNLAPFLLNIEQEILARGLRIYKVMKHCSTGNEKMRVFGNDMMCTQKIWGN